MDLSQVELELKKRIVDYPTVDWGRKQSDDWDKATNFIYHLATWSELQAEINYLAQPVKNYAVNRWFNFWSAQAVEQIFGALPGVTPHQERDKLVDFSLHGLQFDHKTTVYPKGYERTARYAFYNRCDLIYWLYQNQSQQGRYHLGHRLFIVLWAGDGEHWKLRADILALQRIITRYVQTFDKANLTQVQLNGHMAWSDLIWYVKK